MPNEKETVKGVAGLRAKLAERHPKFAIADAFEREIEDACMLLRSNLKAARKNLGIGQIALAEKMQVGQPVISRIENGTGDIGIKTLYRYANALGLTLGLDIQLDGDEKHTPMLSASATAAVEEALENVDKAQESLQAAREQLELAAA